MDNATENASPDCPVIRIAAAVILDAAQRTLLVRKRGTTAFMQAGGKIEAGEAPTAALRRELREELDLTFDREASRHMGRFTAPAANESGCLVEAEVYHVSAGGALAPRAEIEEAVWVDPFAPGDLPLAPLTRDAVLPLVRTLLAAQAR